jgi:hypothetical protein
MRRPRSGRRICRDHDFHGGRHCGGDGAGECRSVRGKDEARRQDVDDRGELLEVLRHQRIGHGDRRIGNADMHGGKAEQRVLDVVTGQDRDRPLGRQIALKQRRRDRAHCGECRRIAQGPPAARGVALRQENPLGRGLRPMAETLGERFRVRRQRLRRAHQDRAVALPLDGYAGRAEPDRPQRRPVFPGVFPGGGERHRIRSEPVLGSRDISAEPRQDARSDRPGGPRGAAI